MVEATYNLVLGNFFNIFTDQANTVITDYSRVFLFFIATFILQV